MRYDGVCDINNYSGCGDYDRYWILSNNIESCDEDSVYG